MSTIKQTEQQIIEQLTITDTNDGKVILPQRIDDYGLIRIERDPVYKFDKMSVPNQRSYAAAAKYYGNRHFQETQPERCRCEIVHVGHKVELMFRTDGLDKTIAKAARILAKLQHLDTIEKYPKSYPKLKRIFSVSEASFPWDYYDNLFKNLNRKS